MERIDRCKQWMEDVIAFYIDKNYYVRPTDGEDLEVIKDAEYILNAIEKQIPQKPMHFEQPLVIDEEIVGVWEYDCCPVCGVEVREEYDSFCNNCGKALNWGREDESV